MPKRSYGSANSLTGGSGDVNPQWFFVGSHDPDTTYAESTASIPIQRLRDGNKSQVMEILKVEFSGGAATTMATSTTLNTTLNAYLTTQSFATTEPTSVSHTGKILADMHLYVSAIATGVNNSTRMFKLPFTVDLTDGAGHGLLVGSDNLFFGSIQTGSSAPFVGFLTCRVLYRWKNVSIAEYVGIVQSQQ